MKSFLNQKKIFNFVWFSIFALMFVGLMANATASLPTDLTKTMTVRSPDASQAYYTCAAWPKAAPTDDVTCGCASDATLRAACVK